MAASCIARADDADPTIVQVGGHGLKASDVTRRIAAVPRYRLASFGASPGEVRAHFVESVLVPELLFAAESDRLKLDSRPDVLSRIRSARAGALIEQIRRDAAAPPVPDGEVKAYFEAHRAEFYQPERLRLARILTDDEALARKILEDVRGAGGPERWSKLAREHSLDDATKMRGGALGFVFPDGRTEYPQLHVDPMLYAAAARVKDGELVGDPVKEGNRFAIVWRRGTLPKVARTVEDEQDRIKEIIVRRRTDDAIQSLLEGLRNHYVTELRPELLESPLPGEAPRPLPSSAPRAAASADPVPKQTDRGLR